MELLKFLAALPRLVFGHLLAHLAALLDWIGLMFQACGYFTESVARYWLDIPDDEDIYVWPDDHQF